MIDDEINDDPTEDVKARPLNLSHFQDEDYSPITKLLVNTIDLTAGNHLFKKIQPAKSNDERNRTFQNEGHAVSEISDRQNKLLRALSDGQTSWYCHFEERTEKELFDTREIFYPERSTLAIRYVEPLSFKDERQKFKIGAEQFSKANGQTTVLQFTFSTVKFNHHPLFSLENVLEAKLMDSYKIFSDFQNTQKIQKFEESINTLREKKNNIILQNDSENAKKLFKNQDLRKCIRELKKLRESRIKELSELKKAEKSILYFWKSIKYVRKKTGITKTSSTLNVKKRYDEGRLREKLWQENIEKELKDTIDELKCDYYEKKEEYNKKLKSKSDKDKPEKPILSIDEDDLRENIQEIFAKATTTPEEPVVRLKLTQTNDILTKDVTDPLELQRRKEIDKIKIHIRVAVNNKMICKSNSFTLNQDFTVNLNENFRVEVKESLDIIEVTVIEKYGIKSMEYSNIIIPIPKNSQKEKFDKYSFSATKKKITTKFGVGNGNSMFELCKLCEGLESPNESYCPNEILFSQGDMKASVYFRSQGSQSNKYRTENFDAVKERPLDIQSLADLFKSNFDPNDPKNAIISTYFDHPEQVSSDNFYLSSNLYLKFSVKMSHLYDVIKESEIFANNLAKYMKRNDRFKGDASNRVDAHRQKSIKYLQSLSTQFLNYEREEVDKKILDILVDVKYPSFRSIALDILHPKKPLFYQSRNQSIVSKSFGSHHKEYLLKICIFKAFHLPNRQDNDRNAMQNENEENLIKMANLRPFVLVNCQGQTKRTTTVVGNNPTWNEEITLSVKNNASSVLTLQVFDEVVENWLLDERLEDSTIHYHYNLHWLGSLKIPLFNIFSQSQIDGTFLLHSPVELLGYKTPTEDKFPNSHASLNGSRKDTIANKGIYLSMYIELFPNCVEPVSTPMNVYANSNEVDQVLQHLLNFKENYKAQFAARKMHPLVVDSNGKYTCFTRFFERVPLMDFGECVKKLFAENREVSASSRSSTPFKKKGSISIERDIDRMSISLSEKHRQSRSTKDVFDGKSINENLLDVAEYSVAMKVQICARYVSMIPTYRTQFFSDSFVVLAANQLLKLSYGSSIDHCILLMGYFAQLGIECWCVAGNGVPAGFSTYVLIKEDPTSGQIVLKRTIQSEKKSLFGIKKNFNYYIYDASSGMKYDIRNPFSPLQRIWFVCNDENIWVNVQNDDRSNLIRLDLSRTADWRPVFQKNSAISCPKTIDSLIDEKNLYTFKDDSAKQLRDVLYEKIKSKVEKWRGHRKTIWNRYCSKILRDSLVSWEKWNLNPSSAKPKYNTQIQQLLLSYEIYGFPLNVPYTGVNDVISAIKGTELHANENANVEFGLGVEVFSYPNHVYSVWAFLASIQKK